MKIDEGPTTALAAFAVKWSPAPAEPPQRTPPADPLRQAKRALLDTCGVALAGSTERASAIAAHLARHEGAAGPAVVIGHDFRTSASHAALANGVTSHALDYDASATVKTTGHPLVALVPAALAAADEVEASGSALLEAIIVGFEVISRIGRAAGGDAGHHYIAGFHGSSVFGVFAATAAAVRLFGLDQQHAQVAFGIAGSAAKGVRANYGTMTKPLHIGEASRAGVVAAMLARDGFTASPNVLEARLGWAAAVVSDSFDTEQIVAGLGADLAIDQGINFKRFPSCGASHAPIRATLLVMAENGLRGEDIESIEVSMSADVLARTLIFPWPTQPLEGKFCVAFVVAAAWAEGRVTVDTFTEATLERLAPYRSRITVVGRSSRVPVVVRASMRDGRIVVAEETGNYFDDASGARAYSRTDLSDDELRQKFRDNVEVARSPERANALLERIDSIDQLASVHELTELLR